MTALPIDCANVPMARLTDSRWLRPAAQWLGVALAHAVVLTVVMHVSPQARQMVGEIIQASLVVPRIQPQSESPEPPKPPKPLPPRQKMQPRQPLPVLTAAATVEPASNTFVVPPQPVAPPAAEPVPVIAPPAPPSLIPPNYNAAYLENPPPVYPSMSRRHGETGRVLLRAYVSQAGHAERVEVRTSSGFERLDEAARAAVLAWRFVPARRGDEAVAAWVQIPIVFVM